MTSSHTEPRNIYLIGFMGSGKTTAGKQLALKLGYNFIDLDRWITQTENKTIAEIFIENGEAAFRELEKMYLEKTFEKTKTIVSCGGGSPCFFDNISQMNKHGETVYLQMNASELFSRLRNSKTERPLLSNKTEAEKLSFITEKLIEREAFYNKAKVIVRGIDLNYENLIAALNRLTDKP